MEYSYVYIKANNNSSTLYAGVTSNLLKRVYEHRNHLVPGFTQKYNIDKLVYYETYEDITEAIKRERQIKSGSRAKKIALIMKINPSYTDLFEDLN